MFWLVSSHSLGLVTVLSVLGGVMAEPKESASMSADEAKKQAQAMINMTKMLCKEADMMDALADAFEAKAAEQSSTTDHDDPDALSAYITLEDDTLRVHTSTRRSHVLNMWLSAIVEHSHRRPDPVRYERLTRIYAELAKDNSSTAIPPIIRFVPEDRSLWPRTLMFHEAEPKSLTCEGTIWDMVLPDLVVQLVLNKADELFRWTHAPEFRAKEGLDKMKFASAEPEQIEAKTALIRILYNKGLKMATQVMIRRLNVFGSAVGHVGFVRIVVEFRMGEKATSSIANLNKKISTDEHPIFTRDIIKMERETVSLEKLLAPDAPFPPAFLSAVLAHDWMSSTLVLVQTHNAYLHPTAANSRYAKSAVFVVSNKVRRVIEHKHCSGSVMSQARETLHLVLRGDDVE